LFFYVDKKKPELLSKKEGFLFNKSFLQIKPKLSMFGFIPAKDMT